MGFRESFRKFMEKRKEEKREFHNMEREERLKRRLEHKNKTPAQKELEFYQREDAKENLQKLLKNKRKAREIRLNKLSSPYGKNNTFKERNNLMSGGIKWT